MALVVVALVVALAVLVSLAIRAAGSSLRRAPVIVPAQCLATAGGHSSAITLEQAGNAAIIAGESMRRGLPPRAATIGLVTAWQESHLRNLDYGDRDSLGLFQQRPSQGWGTPEQIMDPWYAAGAFYAALVKVPGWQTGVINDVAQAVQRSGYPDAYAQHEANGRAWASALTGQSPAAVRCLDRGTVPGDPAVAAALLQRIWGDAVRMETTGRTLLVTVPDAATAWAVAQVTLANTATAGVARAEVGSWSWTMSTDHLAAWSDGTPSATPTVTPSPSPVRLQPNQARLTLRGPG